MLQFSYVSVPLRGPPPSLPAGTSVRWRPMIPIRLTGPSGKSRFFSRALLDTGSEDTVFPLDVAVRLGLALRTDARYQIRWRGRRHPLEFADVSFELTDGASTWRWSATVGFSSAPIQYPLLGYAGCLQFMDATFLGDQGIVKLDVNGSYPGTT